MTILGLESLPHEWLEECRDPLFTLWFRDHFYGFYLFSIPTWIELLTVMLMQTSIAALSSVAIYHTVVVQHRSRQSNTDKHNNNVMPFLLTFGVYLPFWILAPKTFLDYMRVKNKIFRFSLLVVTPTTSVFRVLEAYFGFTPLHAARTVGDFAFYFGSPLIARFDEKSQNYVKTSFRHTVRHLSLFLLLLFTTGLFQSMFRLHPAFPTLGSQAEDGYYAWRHVLDPSKWKETALCAILLQQYLTTFGEGLMFATNLLTGVQTEKLMDNPMFESESPSDFWGRRWNLLIHKSLKGAIYKPIRSMGGSKAMAVFGAFFASGLFHEWVLPCTFSDYPNVHGPNSVFFAWQAMLVAVEAAVGCTAPFQILKRNLPRRVRSLLVILCGVPFGRWFLDSYIHSRFFEQGQMVHFSILPVEQQQ